MRFNPRNVIILQISAVFSALDFPESFITSEEFMEEKLENMLKEIYEDRNRMKSKRKNQWIF